jgi:hypothetical protein
MTDYNRNMQLPTDNYVMRVINEEFSNSKSSGNPMITLELEIQHPDEVEIAGEKVNVAGLKIKRYLPTKNLIDPEKDAKALERVKTEYGLFGLDFEGFNPENPILGFKGKLVHVRLYSKEKEARKAQTPEQKKAGKLGDLIVNPITNKSVISYEPSIAEVYGLAEETGAL